MKKQNSPPGKIPDYKLRRMRVLEIAFLCSLLLLSSLFYSFKKFDHNTKLIVPIPTMFIVENIPVTKPPVKINRPELPKFPVASQDDEFCEEIPVNYGDIDIEKLLASSNAPIGDEEEIYYFETVSKKPELIVKAQPIYPELARKSGTEGMVVVQILIDKKGDVEKAEIYKSVPMLDLAALDAAKRCKFKPAMQRDKYVKVWMAIPFKFMLK